MRNSIRCLLVLPLYGGSLPIGRYCAGGLSSLGHMVEVFEAPDFHGAYTALSRLGIAGERLDYLENGFLQLVSQAVLAKVEAFEPDLVLAMAQAPLTRQVLRRLRKDGVATAMWFVEDFRLFTYWQAYAPLYDFFAVIQKEPFRTQLAEIGQKNALYLPLGADPKFHRPLELTSVERRKWGSDVSFMGAGYPNRRMAFRRLMGRDFKIWGNDWDGDTTLAPYNQMGGARVSPEDCVRIFNASRINLNLHSSMQADRLVSGGDFVNPRTFELAACGAFQLVDERGLLAESFAPDEMATFCSVDDMVEKIDHFLAHPQEREAFANRARERVLAEHTYAARMQSLLDFVAERRPDWPRDRRRTPDFWNEFPEEFRTELGALMERLGLSPDTGFDDLVLAVRRQEGELSELDTAILFLDEWRKQYGG